MGCIVPLLGVQGYIARQLFSICEFHSNGECVMRRGSYEELVPAEDFVECISGRIVADSFWKKWSGVKLRSYQMDVQRFCIPPLHDFLIQVWSEGRLIPHAKSSQGFGEDKLKTGMASVISNAFTCQCAVRSPVRVTHIYLEPKKFKEVAIDVFDRHVEEINLRNILCAEDPYLANIASQLELEAAGFGVGEKIFIDTLRIQASIHLLRSYAKIDFHENLCSGLFNVAHRRRIEEYVLQELSRPILLEQLAGLLNLSVFQFCRRFRATFGMPPHAWLIKQRVAWAKERLRQGGTPLKEIAMDAGFSDQSHMTRMFRRLIGMTPGEYRSHFHDRAL